MNKERIIGRWLTAACLSGVGVVSQAATYTAPFVDLGMLAPWSVQSLPQENLSSGALTYAQTINFSVETASEVRVDVRADEYTNTKASYYTSYFTGLSFTVFDAKHVAVGSSVVDTSFADRACEPGYSGMTACRVNLGLTFSSAGALQVGSYTVELAGQLQGIGRPNMTVGAAALLGGVVPDAYISAVTPVAAIPEPSTAMSLVLGLVGLVVVRRKS